ncbi:MBL fold metallo-hydrolase [Cystobacter fuscus]|uniref:MBL fold metallo-hydrolase n=1 Tax=Cystobacter fuscus TaxID=43 RepID=UPI002B2AB145|nr:MBL fold metallo-hydrolase [Cystobacter fuscus]
MAVHLCSTCGTSYPESTRPPERCPICEDERQYVPRGGQTWTTPEALARGHVNSWREFEPGLLAIHTQPGFAIGQRALLLRTPAGNILWDCVALLDAATEAIVRALGGLRAIALSHPHYYTCMQDWARAFDCPIHLHDADAQWVMRPDAHIQFWKGETMALGEQLTLLRLGGHFPGGTVLHWAAGADQRGALLSGDIVQVAGDTSRVSFLWSYPNMMPLSAGTVRRIAATLAPWRFERIYGSFPGRETLEGGSDTVARSARRYIELLESTQA